MSNSINPRKKSNLEEIQEETNPEPQLNKIQSISNLSSIQQLDISNSQIQEMPYLISLHSLKRLNISKNTLKVFNPGLLPRSIKLVDASRNKIKYVCREHLLHNKVQLNYIMVDLDWNEKLFKMSYISLHIAGFSSPKFQNH